MLMTNKKILGKFTFGKHELDIAAVSGELASYEREASHDTALIRDGEQTQRVSAKPLASVPLRVGDKVTAYFASLSGAEDWQLVAFSDDSAHKLHDVSKSASLPGRTARVIWLAPLVTAGICLVSKALLPVVALAAAEMSIRPDITGPVYVAVSWGSVIAAVSFLVYRSWSKKRSAGRCRTDLVKFIEQAALGATHG
jgi:hypothetical protein